ncbi:Uncharacterized protein HZ326_31018 [Fusarium oxysporum f. sp. albedinis]|nr:Uncharacterized protein HZ326_31018 [Fusarium oxysporum f. sp. albedinis]
MGLCINLHGGMPSERWLSEMITPWRILCKPISQKQEKNSLCEQQNMKRTSLPILQCVTKHPFPTMTSMAPQTGPAATAPLRSCDDFNTRFLDRHLIN